MIILHFGLYGVGIKRAKLFGSFGKYPVISIRFLFVATFIVGGRPEGEFRKAILGMSEDPEWMVENCRAVRLAKKRAYAKARTQLEAEYLDRIERAWSRTQASEDENGRLKNEVIALHRAIKSLTVAGGE